MADTSRGRFWCFTINNPTPAERLIFPDGLPSEIGYLVYQIEKGEDGTEHVQGYVQFKKVQRLSSIKKFSYPNAEGAVVLPWARAHLEFSRGTPAQAAAYCKKEETRVSGPFELGELSTAGKRTDLEEIAEKVKTGVPMRQIAEEHSSTWIRNYKGIAALDTLVHPALDRGDIRVACIEGPPGIGKTTAIIRHEGAFSLTITETGALWADGYAGQDTVLLDDYSGQLSIKIFNQICDPFPFMCPVKGGFVAARWHNVFVLTNVPPSEWYSPVRYHPEAILSVYRRIGYGIYEGKDPIKRYNKVNTRDDLLALFQPKDIPMAAAAPPPRSATPVIISDDDTEEPRLKRSNRHITPDDEKADTC